jgi:RsiW-degrading membrane proteinase PrsW (M82 family)
MVPRVGFEPTTLGLEVLCSIQLSYQGTPHIVYTNIGSLKTKNMASLYLVLLAFVGLSVGLAWYLITHDRGQREPIYALWVAAGLGVAGAFAAGFLEGWLVNDITLLSGQVGLKLLIAALSVGVIEELCKFLPLAVWLYKKKYFNEHTDGVIYFALAGLGFGLPENILYTLQFGTRAGTTRLILTPLFHAAITGLAGYFLINAKLSRKPVISVALPLGAAILLHGIYDFGLLSGSAMYQTLALLITLGLSAGLFMLFLKATQQDQDQGLSAVGHNAFCRSCGWANPKHHLYCTHCGKNA